MRPVTPMETPAIHPTAPKNSREDPALSPPTQEQLLETARDVPDERDGGKGSPVGLFLEG